MNLAVLLQAYTNYTNQLLFGKQTGLYITLIHDTARILNGTQAFTEHASCTNKIYALRSLRHLPSAVYLMSSELMSLHCTYCTAITDSCNRSILQYGF